MTASFHLSDLALADISTAVVYRNATMPIPEPSTGALLGLALLGLAIRRRS